MQLWIERKRGRLGEHAVPDYCLPTLLLRADTDEFTAMGDYEFRAVHAVVRNGSSITTGNCLPGSGYAIVSSLLVSTRTVVPLELIGCRKGTVAVLEDRSSQVPLNQS